MKSVAADFHRFAHLAAPVILALAAVTFSKLPSRADGGHMIVVPASDGYGFDDCLSGNKACGHVIADAWCEAHGMTSAVSFGRADDITASIKANGSGGNHAPAVEAGSFVVNCKD